MRDFLPKIPVIHVVGVVQGQEENNVKGDIIMKFGFRTPSFKRSISARSTGRAKRAIKRAHHPWVWKARYRTAYQSQEVYL